MAGARCRPGPGAARVNDPADGIEPLTLPREVPPDVRVWRVDVALDAPLGERTRPRDPRRRRAGARAALSPSRGHRALRRRAPRVANAAGKRNRRRCRAPRARARRPQAARARRARRAGLQRLAFGRARAHRDLAAAARGRRTSSSAPTASTGARSPIPCSAPPTFGRSRRCRRRLWAAAFFDCWTAEALLEGARRRRGLRRERLFRAAAHRQPVRETCPQGISGFCARRAPGLRGLRRVVERTARLRNAEK